MNESGNFRKFTGNFRKFTFSPTFEGKTTFEGKIVGKS